MPTRVTRVQSLMMGCHEWFNSKGEIYNRYERIIEGLGRVWEEIGEDANGRPFHRYTDKHGNAIKVNVYFDSRPEEEKRMSRKNKQTLIKRYKARKKWIEKEAVKCKKEMKRLDDEYEIVTTALEKLGVQDDE